MAIDAPYTWANYKFDINFAINLQFAALFGVLGIFQLVLIVRQKRFGKTLPDGVTQRYTVTLLPFLSGFILECIGYIARIIKVSNKGPYILQSICLILAPAFMAASIYMSLGELVKLNEAQSDLIIPIEWFIRIFIIGDVISCLLQGIGGGIQGVGDPQTFDTGSKLVITGLCVQIGSLGIFIIICSCFFIKYFPKTKPKWVQSGVSKQSWIVLLSGLIITSNLILITSVFRVIQYFQGANGHLVSNEAYLFILDSTMIFYAGCVYLGIDITYNLSKLYYSKLHQEEYETINVCTSLTQQVEFSKNVTSQFWLV